MKILIRSAAIVGLTLGARAVPLIGQQDAAQVEALAPLIMAQDRRDFDSALLVRSLANPDPLVRRTAAMTIGRIGDHRGTALLLPLLADRDSTVGGDVFFAFGLLRDTAAVGPIVARLRLPDSLASDAVAEAATALDRIGGAAAAQFIGNVLSSGSDLSTARGNQFLPTALLDAWHLGKLMPALAMMRYVTDTAVQLRWNALYSLGRARAPISGQHVLAALRDDESTVRAVAAAALTRRFVDSTTGPPVPERSAKNELVRAFDDAMSNVRVNALGAAATYNDSMLAAKASADLGDDDFNVQVAAATALGSMKGSVAAKELNAVFDRKDATWALKRAALQALAKVDTVLFARRVAAWSKSVDVRERLAAIEDWGATAPGDAAPFRAALADPDARVRAAAIDAWRAARPQPDTALGAAARAHLADADPWIRAAAIDALRTTATSQDVDALAAAWQQSLRDPTSDARIAVVRTLGALAKRDGGVLAQLSQSAGGVVLLRPTDPVVRAEAVGSWPELAARWGDKWPIETNRTLEDYRTVVRKYMLADSNPHVTIEVQGKGTIDVELLGHEAPLTVANFLTLVDRHYFDGDRWHRVVPNFVVQDGDPTGTGNGGPGWSIRDEINRERYALPVLGMALDGPDTGGSQWFFNLAPEPHLDGVYTIFGRVPANYSTLGKILQGDVIRSIHR